MVPVATGETLPEHTRRLLDCENPSVSPVVIVAAESSVIKIDDLDRSEQVDPASRDDTAANSLAHWSVGPDLGVFTGRSRVTRIELKSFENLAVDKRAGVVEDVPHRVSTVNDLTADNCPPVPT